MEKGGKNAAGKLGSSLAEKRVPGRENRLGTTFTRNRDGKPEEEVTIERIYDGFSITYEGSNGRLIENSHGFTSDEAAGKILRELGY